MSNVHTRLLTMSMALAGLALAGCNNRQYENQPDQISTAPAPVEPAEPMDPMEPPPTDPMMQDPGMQTPGQDLQIVDVMQTPTEWVGRTISGKATVTDVPSDRGFWVEAGGQRIFAILNDAPAEDPVDINVGQTVNISEATVRDATFLTSMVGGEPLEEETRQLAQSQPVFLVVDEENIEITGEGTMAPDAQPMDPNLDNPPLDDLPEDEPIENDPPNPIQ